MLVMPEGEDGLVQMRGVEDPEGDGQVDVLDGEACHVVESVLAEVGEIYEGRDTGRELDPFLLNLFSLSLCSFLFISFTASDLSTTVRRSTLQRAKAVDVHHCCHRGFGPEDLAERVVADEHRRLLLACQQSGRGAGHGDVKDAAAHSGAILDGRRQSA